MQCESTMLCKVATAVRQHILLSTKVSSCAKWLHEDRHVQLTHTKRQAIATARHLHAACDVLGSLSGTAKCKSCGILRYVFE